MSRALRVNVANSARRRRGGFTLLEVLLASSLFAITLLSFAGIYIGILNSLEAVKLDHALTEELRWLRERVLSEGDRDALEKGGSVQTLDLGAATWRVGISPTGVADLFQIELSVEVGEGDKRHQKTDTLQVLRPTWSDAVERGKIIEAAKTQIEAGRRDKGTASAERSSGARGGGRNSGGGAGSGNERNSGRRGSR